MQSRRHQMRKRRAQRPPPNPPRASRETTSHDDTDWIMLDGRPFFVVGYTPGGAPYGVFEDEMES